MLRILTEREKSPDYQHCKCGGWGGGGGLEIILLVSQHFSLELWVQFSTGAMCGLTLLFLPCLKFFFSGYSGFPSSTKSGSPNLISIEDPHERQLRLM